ncbi:MAG: hypothetical protein Kow0077_26540 [Anaerolineae bacterium]
MKRFEPAAASRVLLPVINLRNARSLAALVDALVRAGAERVVLAGVVGVAPEQPLSSGMYRAAQRRRDLAALREMWAHLPLEIDPHVRVSHDPLAEIALLVSEHHCDAVVLRVSNDGQRALGQPVDAVLGGLNCQVLLQRGRLPERVTRILLASRGGEHALHALEVTKALAATLNSEISLLHVTPSMRDSFLAENTEELRRDFRDSPLITRTVKLKGSLAELVHALPRQLRDHQLLVIGTPAREGDRGLLGERARVFLAERRRPAIIVHTPADRGTPHGRFPPGRDIALNVDRWFAENTFHSDEFADLEELVRLKEAQGLTISLGLPALNEEETIGNIISTVREALMERVPLLDEIVVIDSNSTDNTVAIAESLGVPVYRHPEILPEMGSYRGKGEALWKSLHVLKGDIVAWIDTDIVNIHPRFVYGILGPLLTVPHVQYVKGFYRRPLRVGDKLQAGGGGRVTELVARPMFNLFFPQLSGIVQPLAGEYAGRREVFERVPFFTGYAVETGLLIDIVSQYGLSAIAQVDLQERIHHNQSLKALSRMSFVILQALLARMDEHQIVRALKEPSRSMKLISQDGPRLFLDIEELTDHERPPIITVPGYRARRQISANLPASSEVSLAATDD